jgi:hypothetical protein
MGILKNLPLGRKLHAIGAEATEQTAAPAREAANNEAELTTSIARSANQANAALLEQIRKDVRHAAELAAYLALHGTSIAAVADPSQTTLTDLAAAGRSVADQARATSEAIILLTAPATSQSLAAQPATASTVVRLGHAEQFVAMLECQIQTAVRIYALIRAELSDRCAVAEEWNADSSEQLPSPASARALAIHVRMLLDSLSS